MERVASSQRSRRVEGLTPFQDSRTASRRALGQGPRVSVCAPPLPSPGGEAGGERLCRASVLGVKEAALLMFGAG